MFSIDEIDLDFTLIIQISKSAHHGVHFIDGHVCVFVVGGRFVEFVCEFELPPFLLVEVLTHSELMLDGDVELAVLVDDLLNVKYKFIIGIQLLFD